MRANENSRFNWVLIFAVLAISGLGLVNLSSVGRTSSTNLAIVQGVWVGGSLLLAMGIAILDYQLVERLAYPIFFALVLSLVGVLAIGKVVNNSRRWIGVGPINIQPSELMKIGVILAMAKYFSDDAQVSRPRSMLSKLLIYLHPVYPIAALVILIWNWNNPKYDFVVQYHWILVGALFVWEPLAIWHFLHESSSRRAGDLEYSTRQRGDKTYTLDDLFKPESPLYGLGALGGLILFWDKDFMTPLGAWRFLLIAAFIIWTAFSSMFAVRNGRTSFHDLVSPVLLLSMPAVLIIKQPDLGTALVLLAAAASMILFMRMKLASLIIAVAILLVASVASWNIVLKPYQQNRIKAFWAPSKDTKDTGYHSRQSIIAVGSGGLFGKGYGKSTQTRFRFLPEQHTDFVFSVWAEEQGFVGCLVVLALFSFLLLQIVNIASGAKDRFGVLICIGMASLLFWHVFINIGMVIGVVPVVGLTLPLWSYGGSSVLAFFLGFGLILSVYYHRGIK